MRHNDSDHTGSTARGALCGAASEAFIHAPTTLRFLEKSVYGRVPAGAAR